MELNQIIRWRSLVGKVGMVVGTILLIALVDAVITKHRTPLNVVNLLPGTTEEISGPVVEQINGIDDLISESSSPLVTLVVEAVFPGYWFGGDMWRGTVTASPEAPPGKYSLSVKTKAAKSNKPPQTFRINVFANAAARNRQAISWAQRYFGVSPWWLVAACFPLLVLTGVLTFWFSSKIDAQRARSGQAEVYRTRRLENGLEITFGLGAKQGVQTGAWVTLCDGEGHAVGRVEVLEVADNDAVGVIDGLSEIGPGYFVSQTPR